MPTFRVTAPDGTVYNVTGDNADGAYEAVQQMHVQKAQPGEGVSADPNPPLLPDERPLTVGPDRAAAGTEPEPSVGESAVRGARSGATFNWGDELAGLSAASPIPGQSGQPDINAIDTILGALRLGAENVAPSVFGQAGHQAQQAMAEKVKAENAAAQEAHPNAYLGGELGGGAASAVMAPMLTPFKVPAALGMAAKAKSLIPAAANLALTGGVYGGVAGAGGAEGDIGDRATGAGAGAAGGAVLGPLVGGAAGTAAAFGRGAANQVRAFTNPIAIADRIISEMTGRRGDAADLPALVQRMRDAHAQGQPVTLGDIAGPNTQALAGQVLRNPGEARAPARDFVIGRQEGIEPTSQTEVISQGDRVAERVGNILSHRGLIQTTKSLIDKRAADSQPLYEAAHIKPINYDTAEGQKLLAALDRIPPQAKNNANRLLAVSNEGGNQVIWKKLADGTYQMVPVPNTRRFDYIKRGIDDLIKDQKGPDGRYNEYGRALINLKKEILGHLDKLVPEYGAAREMFAGHSELLDALKEGSDIWEAGYTKEKLAETLKGMTDGEKAMLRVSAADKLLNKIDNMTDAADKARVITRSAAYREKMRMIAPDQKSYNALKEFLQNEQVMHKTYAQTGGSPTAERLKQDETTERIMGAGRMLASAATNHWRAFTYEAFRNLSRISPQRRSAVMEAVRNVVLNPDAAAVEKFINKVNSGALSPSHAQKFISTVVNTLPRTTVTEMSGKRQEAH